MIYLDLLIGFLEVGLFSFGGAYAAIPLIRDVVISHGWMDDEMLSYRIEVSESTPGPLMVNLATYVGSNRGGLLGALIATTAVVLPAFFIILIVMVVVKNLLKNPYVQAAMDGLKPCVMGGGVDIRAVLVTLGFGAIYFGSRKVLKKGLSPIGLICLAALTGVAVYGI